MLAGALPWKQLFMVNDMSYTLRQSSSFWVQSVKSQLSKKNNQRKNEVEFEWFPYTFNMLTLSQKRYCYSIKVLLSDT